MPNHVAAATLLGQAVAIFGASAKAKLSNPAATGEPEDQLRAPLEALFAALAPLTSAKAATLVGETSLAELKTRPDYSVTVRKALVGFIEVKAPGKGANPTRYKGHDKDQWDKLKALPNLLYTDGDEWALYRDGKRVGAVVQLTGGVESAGSALSAPATLLPLIDDFLSWAPISPKTAPALAETTARLCRFLRDEVVEQMEAGSKPLTDLYADWRTLLFPEASHAEFADGYAQAVTFGLLMARSQGLSLTDDLDRVAKKLGETNTLIGTALRLLTEEPEAVLSPSLDTLRRVLGVVDWATISKGNPEAWIYFYEQFLTVYDQTLRRKSGSYYTPPEVVRAMVRLCDEALRSPGRFAKPTGLADANVHIADPAMGSGTFLLALLRRIAETVEDADGAGAVGGAITAAAKRVYGFELQFGAFAVAQLRMVAEMMALEATGQPHLYVTDTLSDPYEHEETGTGMGRVLSRSRVEANRVKQAQPITVVIGNPPYKNDALGLGGWVENQVGNRPPILNDWQPPTDWGVGLHTNHLRNLYVYFWRWAAWKVFEQGAGAVARDNEEPEPLSGMICYITTAGFLNGPGFQKMRADLRAKCDEIWIIDCSPEGHQPAVRTRIFQGVQQPVCIVLALRSPEPNEDLPAAVRFRALTEGAREEKFAELAGVTLADEGWQICPSDLRAPFLPELKAQWSEMPSLEALIGDSGSGTMPGRTWVIAPDKASLIRRWQRLVKESDAAKRATLFHPHLRNDLPGDRHIAKASRSTLAHPNRSQQSVESQIREAAENAREAVPLEPVRYAFRSFDRQWVLPDNRLLNSPNPSLWAAFSRRQIYLTAPTDQRATSGPALTFTSLMPDLHHYHGRGGRVFSLWRDAAGTQPNVSAPALDALTDAAGRAVTAPDVMAYLAAVAAHPAYTAYFAAELKRPGLRIPVTADAALFEEAVALGRRVVWLHTYGDRFADPAATPPRPAGPPRGVDGPTVPAAGAIPPGSFPNELRYDAADRRLHVGQGHIDRVSPAVWAYEVSGKRVVSQWFSYRKLDRSRPIIGDRRPPSPLGDIQPDHWLAEYTSEMVNLLCVLTLLVELEPAQADLLDRIVAGALLPAAVFAGG